MQDLGRHSQRPSDGLAMVYNLIRIVMLRAAQAQGVNVHRVWAHNTLAWLRYGDIYRRPALIVNPLRPGRLEPRVIKRQKKSSPT